MMNLTFGSGSATARIMNHTLLQRVSPLRMETNGDHNAHTQKRRIKKVESNDHASLEASTAAFTSSYQSASEVML
jgi:hypothetical protein